MRASMAVTVLAISLAAGAIPALAQQAEAPPPKSASVYDGVRQIALTEAQVAQYIAALQDMDRAMGDSSPEPGEPPDAQTVAKLETVAKTYKFASYDEFNTVAGNIALVLDGIDPKTKKYIGAETMLNQTMTEVRANTDMSVSDRQETLAELADELKNVTPVKFPGNIDLVMKNYDALADSEPGQKL
jgi:hypothetical protein